MATVLTATPCTPALLRSWLPPWGFSFPFHPPLFCVALPTWHRAAAWNRNAAVQWACAPGRDRQPLPSPRWLPHAPRALPGHTSINICWTNKWIVMTPALDRNTPKRGGSGRAVPTHPRQRAEKGPWPRLQPHVSRRPSAGSVRGNSALRQGGALRAFPGSAFPLHAIHARLLNCQSTLTLSWPLLLGD